jgi:hypothetical protein
VEGTSILWGFPRISAEANRYFKRGQKKWRKRRDSNPPSNYLFFNQVSDFNLRRYLQIYLHLLVKEWTVEPCPSPAFCPLRRGHANFIFASLVVVDSINDSSYFAIVTYRNVRD